MTEQTEQEKEQQLYEECVKQQAREHFTDFAHYIHRGELDWTPLHLNYYEILNEFAQGNIQNLIVTMPPQHGKSEGSTRLLPPYMLGQDPNKKIAICSYAASLAQDFCRDNQRILDSPEYRDIFPGTYLSSSNVVTRSNLYKRNMNIVETVGHKGFLKVTGRGGGLTGTPLDVAILDDLYKDAEEGNSPTVRETAWKWYTSVVVKRLRNKGQTLIVFTRWHEDDIIGRIKKKEPVREIKKWSDIQDVPRGTWLLLNIPALKEGQPTPIDPRKEGEALWRAQHDEWKLEREREIDPIGFACMNQGDPLTAEGLLYSPFKTYVTPSDYGTVIGTGNYTDTADTGTDYLCSINYTRVRSRDLKDEKGKPIIFALVTDMVYTNKPIEHTVEMVAAMLNRENIETADVESNNGGRSFATQVARKCRRTVVKWFHQSKNKESRILTHQPLVNFHIIMPLGWESRFPLFYEHITEYRREFATNEHDDGPDTITGIVERGIDTIQIRGIKQKN